jgi:hypothetical protein
MVWKDRQNVNVLTNMLPLPVENNFCDEYGKALKLAIVEQCMDRCMG